MAADADWLRRAADRLDTVSALIAIDPAMGVIVTGEVRALLRAVAAHHVSDSDGELCYVDRELWPCPQMRAALALADTILGAGVSAGVHMAAMSNTDLPFACCDHCGCPAGERVGHDDTCAKGCNDERQGPHHDL